MNPIFQLNRLEHIAQTHNHISHIYKHHIRVKSVYTPRNFLNYTASSSGRFHYSARTAPRKYHYRYQKKRLFKRERKTAARASREGKQSRTCTKRKKRDYAPIAREIVSFSICFVYIYAHGAANALEERKKKKGTEAGQCYDKIARVF